MRALLVVMVFALVGCSARQDNTWRCQNERSAAGVEYICYPPGMPFTQPGV